VSHLEKGAMSVDTATAPTAPPPGGEADVRRRTNIRTLASNNVILLALIVLIVLFSVLSPDAFFTLTNFEIILGSQSTVVMLSLAVTVALVANEFDLSVGSVMAFTGVLLATLTTKMGWPLAAALLVTLLAAFLIGCAHAYLTIRVGISSFIVTLGSGTLLAGLATKITDSQILSGLPEFMSTITATKVLGVQVIFAFAIVIAFVIWYVLEATPLGRWATFVGSGADVARLAGLPVDGIRAGALIVSACIAGLVGVLQAGLLGAADPNAGTSYLLPAFAAAFLGATTIKPGRFNAWGTVLAVYMVIVGIVGLQITTGASGWIVNVFNGGMLIVAVAVSRLLDKARDGQGSPA
jgi:ribose transport system permease protein